MDTVDVRPFEDEHAAGVARLATTVQWPSLTDAEVVRRICTAPGATSFVAVTEGEVVGWAQALGDGVLQAHLSFLAVHPDHRRRGIARALVVVTFQTTGAARLDLIADPGEAAGGFYEQFAHRRMVGFRLYPGAASAPGEQPPYPRG
ncbi:GNAT family N-acetyltransferase [Nocardioides sp.]|uniref:GNAT family N-acetyltransferase n=1 Tax=Nocardioides sp. TaxID=35761 RepID=UPI002B26DC10|nr:GNAT family N-acetyltransferase [Nocardioides sp.]